LTGITEFYLPRRQSLRCAKAQKQRGLRQRGSGFAMDDRRTLVRHKTFIRGRIFFNNGLSSVDCIVRDLGESGSRLEVSETVALPDVFDLYLPNKDEYFHAKVEWRKGNNLGISWVSEQPSGPGAEHADPQSSFADRLAKLEREVASLKKRLDTHHEL
jgi:hypothetical protein